MLVTVSAATLEAERVTVECTSALGPFTAWWQGPALPPAGELDVDLGVSDRLTWGDNVTPLGAASPAGSCSLIVGRVQAVEDGFVVLRTAGGVLALEVAGRAPDGIVGELVTVAARWFEVWPAHVG